jgi:ankyrin repeat protein
MQADTFVNTAEENGILSVAEMIDLGIDVNSYSRKQNTALYVASMKGYIELVKLLLDKGASVDLLNDGKYTALYTASQNGYTEVVKILLDKGASVDLLNDGKYTALYKSSQNGHTEVVKLLLDKGASVNLLNDGKYTALYTSSQNGHTEVVKILLDKGASVDFLNSGKATALYIASNKGHTETVKLLLAAGASIDLINEDKFTALYMASKNGHTDTVKLLLDAGASVNILNVSKYTALYTASQEGHTEIVKLLLDKGASVDLLNDGKYTALYTATQEGHTEIVKLLLDAGASVDFINAGKFTALYTASRKGHANIVKLLLDKGASVDIVVNGETIYEIAMSESNDAIKELFLASKPKKPYTRTTKSTIEKFSVFLAIPDYPPNPTSEQKIKAEKKAVALANQFSLCPICMDFVERSMGCLYMSHICDVSRRHSKLYKAYKNEDELIWWCTDCGRICRGHRHYKLPAYPGDNTELLRSRNPFAENCLGEGGGSIKEKLARISRLIDVYADLQNPEVEMGETEARDLLIEQMWNGPFFHLFVNPQTVKRWKTDISIFPSDTATADVDTYSGAPAGSYETPIIQENEYCLTDLPDMDDPNKFVAQFIHKNKNGLMYNHVSATEVEHPKRFMCREELLTHLQTGGDKMGKCFDDECGGYFYPEEIEKAFELLAERDGRPISDAEREALVAYRNRFPVQRGGRRIPSLDSFIHPMTNGKCSAPPKRGAKRRRVTIRKNKPVKYTKRVSKL